MLLSLHRKPHGHFRRVSYRRKENSTLIFKSVWGSRRKRCRLFHFISFSCTLLCSTQNVSSSESTQKTIHQWWNRCPKWKMHFARWIRNWCRRLTSWTSWRQSWTQLGSRWTSLRFSWRNTSLRIGRISTTFTRYTKNCSPIWVNLSQVNRQTCSI